MNLNLKNRSSGSPWPKLEYMINLMNIDPWGKITDQLSLEGLFLEANLAK